ncbi:hypothetical protein EZV62_012815 [Acer yangbiense]|uniref:Golgin candidate 1 n=1 Tax=Acer yangbiense TaxID=1000413 RepID=A0A5C7HZA1_9ROSI|nr:hypothetical protein EZV62_012815 [Acer yangbiense]
MASWLKAAEDLFEVVDRRAKLVVNDLADEQSDSQSPASNGQGSQAKRKSRTKAQKRLSKNESPEKNGTAGEQSNTQASQIDVTSNKDRANVSVENERTPTGETQRNSEQQQDTKIESLSIASIEPLQNDIVKHAADQAEVPETVDDADNAISTSNGELLNENASNVHVEQSASTLHAKEIEIVNEENSNGAVENIKPGDSDVSLKIDNERPPSLIADSPVNIENPSNDVGIKVEPPVNKKKQQEQKADKPPGKLQELEEAQGLLKTAISTGQSKEARLARVCAGLSSRLQEYKSENAQLEELLVAERELSKSYEARIKQLQQELSASKSEVSRVESSMVEALAAKNSEIEALVNSTDALKKQAALSEGNLASLQKAISGITVTVSGRLPAFCILYFSFKLLASDSMDGHWPEIVDYMNMDSIMRNRELTETRMMQALREELASAERRAEEERAAHHATKMAAMEREVELEHRAVESSTALARIQRIADERTAKAGDLEQKVALLEVECASLNQELQDMEARVRRGQKKSPEEANQVIQMQAWQEEVERARQGQRDAESKLSSLEASISCLIFAELQKMRVEMAAMKRDAEHYSREEHMELEKRYRELTDLLYYKQTQLETMASEKAAAEFQLEKEIKRLQEAQVEAERSRVSRRSWSSSWEEEAEMKTLESLPLHHRHMAGASIQLQKAAKLLDSGAVRATRFLWRYPTARVILLFYLVRTVNLIGICTFLFDVFVASPSGTNKPIIFLLGKLQNLWVFPPLTYHDRKTSSVQIPVAVFSDI